VKSLPGWTHRSPVLYKLAARVVRGLGARQLGEWREHWQGVVHLRRRMSPDEQARVGAATDLRGTPEALERATAMGRLLSLIPPEVLAQELVVPGGG
jgi:hypothetical protein